MQQHNQEEQTRDVDSTEEFSQLPLRKQITVYLKLIPFVILWSPILLVVFLCWLFGTQPPRLLNVRLY